VWLTSVPSLVSASGVTNEEQLLLENKVNSVQGKVFVNNVKTGETTKAYQNIITYPDGSMSILQKNLTTGEISLQGINSSGQRIFEKSLTLRIIGIPYVKDKSNELAVRISKSSCFTREKAEELRLKLQIQANKDFLKFFINKTKNILPSKNKIDIRQLGLFEKYSENRI